MNIAEYTIGLVAMAAAVIAVLAVGTLASAELLPVVRRNRESTDSQRRTEAGRPSAHIE
jgi:hypothetical protein